MKICVVFGTRPEAIKLAPVIHELKRRSVNSGLQTVVCVTGQHREMLDQVLALFDLAPDYDLEIMVPDQTPSAVADAILSRLQPVLEKERPDWVTVLADTTSTAAASLASFYARTPVAHVEAGLRTHDKWQPFPEELNRRIVGVIADLHLAPTGLAEQNLINEGVSRDLIFVTGNPVIDALHEVSERPAPSNMLALLRSVGYLPDGNGVRLILVTAHRRENFGPPMEDICLALRELADLYAGRVHFLYPVHLNPSAAKSAHGLLGNISNITLLPPLDYLSLVHVMKRSYLILTDSGGIQEEAPSLGKPVLVLRNVTERPEAVDAGTVKVIGNKRARIVREVVRLLEDRAEYERMARVVNPYGDGRASRRIVAALLGDPVEPFASPS